MLENLDPNYPRVNGGKGEVVDVRWYGAFKLREGAVASVGAVLVWYEADQYLVAYVGAARTGKPVSDAVNIAEWGNKLEPAAARGIWPEQTLARRFKSETQPHVESVRWLLNAAESLEEKMNEFAKDVLDSDEQHDSFTDLGIHISRLRERLETLLREAHS